MKRLILLLVFGFYNGFAQNLVTVKPTPEEFITNDLSTRDFLADWLVDGCWVKTPGAPVGCPTAPATDAEYEGYDGWYNNLAQPDLGAIDTALLRRWPAAYEDGTYKPSGSNRPNPLTLSEELLKGKTGTMSRTGKNAFLVFFGQQVVEEILDAQRAACPPEYFNVPIPKNHPYRSKHSEMPVLRTRYDMRTGLNPNNPRQQINEITPYIDGGLVYGTTKAWSDVLRTYSNGTVDPDGLLAHSHGGLFPEYNTIRLPMANPPPPAHHSTFIKRHELLPIDRFFKLGNPRGNENPFLLTFGILWFRWHNFLARNIRRKNPTWSSDLVYNEARKWVIATYQRVVLYEWLPAWLGVDIPPYSGYDPSVNPQIDQFFQAAAFRFGHTLVVPGVYLRDYGRNGCNTNISTWGKASVRTCNNFWRPQDVIKTKYQNGGNEFVDIDRLLMGMAYQLCEEEDHRIVEDLRGRVFGPLEFSRRDLMAINIQRGRDHGLPDFNSARQAFGLPPVTNSKHFPVANSIRKKLLELYDNDLNNIDPWVGGILETRDGPGELFRTVISDQFQRIRNGDRFWFENTANKLFTPVEMARIRQLTVYDVVAAVTKIDFNDIQENVFQAPTESEVHSQCLKFMLNKTCNYPNTTSLFQCFHLPQLNDKLLNEECTPLETYDYFSNSPLSFILSFGLLATFVFGLIGFVYILGLHTHKKIEAKHIGAQVRKTMKQNGSKKLHPHLAMEWEGPRRPLRTILVTFDAPHNRIQVHSLGGELLRALMVTMKTTFDIYICSDGIHCMLHADHEYDLVLQFTTESVRKSFLDDFETFVGDLKLQRNKITSITLKALLKIACTKADRQKRLEKFFRVVFSQAFGTKHSLEEILTIDSSVARDVIYTELTPSEFAEALSMRSDSEFASKMFRLIDKDKNGFISFREFVDMLIIFTKGNADQKAKLMFDMYDIDGIGELTREDFTNMIRSLMETVDAKANPKELDNTIVNMMSSAGLKNKDTITFQDFLQLLARDKDKLNYARLDFSAVTPRDAPAAVINQAKDTFDTIYADPRELAHRVGGESENESFENLEEKAEKMQIKIVMKNEGEPTERSYMTFIQRYIALKAREIFWGTLFTIVLLAIFAERAYYYSVEREHSGLRRIAGYGVTITRGAASAQMFAYSVLLLTMCRNTITSLRDTIFNKYVPFDSAVDMHKYIALWGLFFTILHVFGHGFNFYHISTQPSDDLTCLFRNYFHATHEIPKFHYWLWQTITGFTGVLLTILTATMYIFAIPYVRQNLYNWFWITHAMYPLFYILMVLHGAGRLIQAPFFWYFFVGPVTLFTLDTLYSLSRKKIEISVSRAELLPSDVTLLEFRKPTSFVYKSGQWVRIACLGHSAAEYHPFTLSSSPHEPNLTVHIRAVGPWTRNIRELYNKDLLDGKSYPRIYLDGPFGEAHQDWYQYDVSVLIGGGIGVTPFASILKDIVHKANNGESTQNSKVYFLWVTRTQRQFEWLVDIIRDVESIDQHKKVSVHLFVTQFYQKYDLRTILLYICELHFQRTAKKSLFTGLKAITHFGRPNFDQFFNALKILHSKVPKIGVFSCGPPPMIKSVEQACISVNTESDNGAIFEHHYKNF